MVGDMRNKWFPYVKVAGLKCLFVYLKVRIFKFSYRSFHFSIFSFVFLVLKNFFCILLFFQSHFFYLTRCGVSVLFHPCRSPLYSPLLGIAHLLYLLRCVYPVMCPLCCAWLSQLRVILDAWVPNWHTHPQINFKRCRRRARQ